MTVTYVAATAASSAELCVCVGGVKQPHSDRTGYLLEAKGLGSFLLVELPLFKVQYSLIHIDDAQLHLLLQGNELPLARCFHPSKWVVDARRGPVPPWPHGWL